MDGKIDVRLGKMRLRLTVERLSSGEPLFEFSTIDDNGNPELVASTCEPLEMKRLMVAVDTILRFAE